MRDSWRLCQDCHFYPEARSCCGSPSTAERPSLQVSPGRGGPQSTEHSPHIAYSGEAGAPGRPGPLTVTGHMERTGLLPAFTRDPVQRGRHHTGWSSMGPSRQQHPDPLMAPVQRDPKGQEGPSPRGRQPRDERQALSLEPGADRDPGSSAACQDRGCHPVGTTAAIGAAGSSPRPRACWASRDAERASWAHCRVDLDAVRGSGHPSNRQSVGWGPQLQHCLGTCYKVLVSDQSAPPGEGPSRCVLSQVLEGTWLCTRPENHCWRGFHWKPDHQRPVPKSPHSGSVT